jgi:hypothetical protein
VLAVVQGAFLAAIPANERVYDSQSPLSVRRLQLNLNVLPLTDPASGRSSSDISSFAPF